MIAIVGWLGALCMVAASFAMPNLLGFYLAVLGLSLLTGQAYDCLLYTSDAADE